jgi:hypothetical protein
MGFVSETLNFINSCLRRVTFKTTKIQLPINQIDYQNIATFSRGITLPNLEWGQTPSTTLDMKTQT